MALDITDNSGTHPVLPPLPGPHTLRDYLRAELTRISQQSNAGGVLLTPILVFIAQPHEANKPATDYMGLPTREMYAYKGSVLLGGTTKSLDNPAVYPVGGIRYSIVKILKLEVGEPWLNQINTTKPDAARAVYCGVTDFLASKPTLVTWAHGNNSANWVSSNAMKQCKPIGDFADVTNKTSGIDLGTMRQPDKEKLKYT